MPDVSSPAGASGDLPTCQKSGPGKYRPSPFAKTMCGSSPLRHWPANSERSSVSARSWFQRAYPMAMHAESQLHWWGYRYGDGLVACPSQFASSTANARRAS